MACELDNEEHLTRTVSRWFHAAMGLPLPTEELRDEPKDVGETLAELKKRIEKLENNQSLSNDMFYGR